MSEPKEWSIFNRVAFSCPSTKGVENHCRDRRSSSVSGIGLWISLMLLFIVCGCSRSGDSRIHVTLHDVPEDKSHSQTSHITAPTACPPGNPVGNDASSTPVGPHSVTLSWIASTSAGVGKDIRYCLYRTTGGPVQKSSGTTGTSPCLSCQLVTPTPVTNTNYQDTHVQNGVHYCYVAIAIDAGNSRSSDFSNQTDAVIPPNVEAPFCTPKNTEKTSPKGHRSKK